MIADGDSFAFKPAVIYCEGANDSKGDNVVHPILFSQEYTSRYSEEDFGLLLIDGKLKELYEELRWDILHSGEVMSKG